MMTELTTIQRERLIRDITNHETESRHISKESFEVEEVEAFRETLEASSDDDLLSMWRGHVGEWLCSIGPEYPSFYSAWEAVESEYESPAEWQLEVLLDDGDIEYGYQQYVYSTPYQNVT